MALRMKRLLIVALCLLLVPVIGVWIGQSVEAQYESQFASALAKNFGVAEQVVKSSGATLAMLCQKEDEEFRSVCSYVDDIHLFQQGSLWALILGTTLIALILLSKYLVGESRQRLAAIFNPIATISLIILIVSILAQGAILVYGIYIAEVVFTERYHPKLIGIIGLGALVAAFVLIKSSLFVIRQKPSIVFGEKLTERDAPGLFGLIDELAKRLGARKPDNVIVGLEPNFYVTAAATQPIADDKPLKGTTLYISLPFLRIFSRNELSAVIGHELGHFKGEDTAYSMRFYPAYSKLYRAIGSMNQQADSENSSAIFAVPALATLSFVLEEFGVVERAIGRRREMEADKAGASVASAESLVTALMKVAEYSSIWTELREYNIGKLAEGTVYTDLAGIYCAAGDARFSEIDPVAMSEQLSSSTISHPTDTHPTLSERMNSLGVRSTAITPENVKPSQTPFTEYLANHDSLSEKLSISEHRLMVALGRVVIPENSDGKNQS